MPVTMPQALEFVGSLVWDYWDETAMLCLLAPYVRDQLQANRDDGRAGKVVRLAV